MCANCGFPAAPGHWTDAGTASSAHERVRGRFRRAQVLQSVLPSYGLSAYNDGLNPGIILGTRTGTQVIAHDLAELWATAEALLRAPVDPLDPRFTGGRAEPEEKA